MKLCAIQIPFVKRQSEVEKSVRLAIEELNNCDPSCDIILTPEYTNAPGAFPTGECTAFAAAMTPALLEAARNAAVRCNAIVAVNYVCEAEKGVFRNTTELFDRQGHSVGRFFKQHLPLAETMINQLDEEYTRKFRPATVLEADGIKFGFLICYDIYFSEYVANLARENVDVVLVSSFQRAERQDILRMQNVHLAFNCNAYVLRAAVSTEVDSELGGDSMVVAPDGRILCEFGNQIGRMDCIVESVKYKYMRPNSFTRELIPNNQFVEQARATWAYRPCGSMTVEENARMDYPRIGACGGLTSMAPSNTLPAIGAAVALGAEEIKLDVFFSSDGCPVTAESDLLEKISNGSGCVAEKTFAQLRSLDFGSCFSPHLAGLKIAALEDVLCKFARHAVFNLHLKNLGQEPEKLIGSLVKLLKIYDHDKHTYFTANEDIIACVKKVAPEFECCLNCSGDPKYTVDRAVELQCCKVQFTSPYLTSEIVGYAHENALKCVLTGCDDPAEAVKYLSMGIDTVLSGNFFSVAAACGKLSN